MTDAHTGSVQTYRLAHFASYCQSIVAWRAYTWSTQQACYHTPHVSAGTKGDLQLDYVNLLSVAGSHFRS